jgi:hypothetical protein
MKIWSAHADESHIRWLGHSRGALSVLYVVDFWASLAFPQVRWITSQGPFLIGGWLAVGLSIIAGKKASKFWYLATVACVLTLLLIAYAASV